MQVNPSKPRRGSFEVTLLRPDNSREWRLHGGRGEKQPGHLITEGVGGSTNEYHHNLVLSDPLPGVELWTGIKKGPPRKLKFPEPQEVVEELKKHLS